MEFIANNWDLILFILVVVVVLASALYRFLKMPREEQMEAVRQWLLGAVTEAEKDLGGGTGRLKLRYVYDRFVVRFPWLAKIVSFETFSGMVDDALDEMRDMLDSNEAVKKYVEGEEVYEVAKEGF